LQRVDLEKTVTGMR